MMGYYDGYGGFGMGFFGIFWMAILWIGIIWFIIWLVKQLSQQDIKTSEKSATEILKERYAKGEITKKEYDQMKKDMNN